MNRRDFVKTSLGAAAAVNFMSSSRAAAEKPNLLFLWTDQQRRDTMKVYGNERIQTPHLDRLATGSCVFEYPYVSQPVCTPSRSTLMTGYWPHQNGLVHNNISLAPIIPCLPDLLGDSSYSTGYYGKWHLGDEVFPQHGFQEWETIEDGYNRYFRPGRDTTRMSTYNQFLREKRFTPDEPDGSFSRDMAAGLPLELSKTRFLEDKTKDFLKRHKGNPFILCVNFLEPHPPYFGALSDFYSPENVVLPGNLNHRPGDTEPLRYQLLIEKRIENPRTGYPLETEAAWRRLVASYWGLVTQVDRSVGAILGTLDDLGLANNTIVVYTSDHGEMLGSHGMLQKGMTYEECQTVPWLMRVPGIRGQVLKGRYSHIDMVPTLLDVMGKPRQDRLPGQSLLPVMRGETEQRRDVFVEWNPAPLDNELEDRDPRSTPEEIVRVFSSYARTVVTQDGWKLSLRNQDKSELYNLQNDPMETTNLYGKAEVLNVTERLTRRIQEWQREVEDIAPIMA